MLLFVLCRRQKKAMTPANTMPTAISATGRAMLDELPVTAAFVGFTIGGATKDLEDVRVAVKDFVRVRVFESEMLPVELAVWVAVALTVLVWVGVIVCVGDDDAVAVGVTEGVGLEEGVAVRLHG